MEPAQRRPLVRTLQRRSQKPPTSRHMALSPLSCVPQTPTPQTAAPPPSPTLGARRNGDGHRGAQGHEHLAVPPAATACRAWPTSAPNTASRCPSTTSGSATPAAGVGGGGSRRALAG